MSFQAAKTGKWAIEIAAAGLSWAAAAAADADDGNQLTPLVGLMNLDAKGGLANSIVEPILSGLPSLELLTLVTNEDELE